MLAQLLPEHILEDIALYLTETPSIWMENLGRPPPLEHRLLVAPARVCRAWREAIVPVLYQTAHLAMAKREEPRAPVLFELDGDRPRLTLQQAVASRCQKHVRRLEVEVFEFKARKSWADQSQHAVALLRTCGRLRAVRTVALRICPELWGMFEQNRDAQAQARLARRVAAEFDALLDVIAGTMPGIQHVEIHSQRDFDSLSTDWPTTTRLVQRAFWIVTAHTARLTLAGHVAIECLPAALPASALCRITVTDTNSLDRCGELIRRNARTLEWLYMGNSVSAHITNFFFGYRDPRRATVYPRLTNLVLYSGSPNYDAEPYWPEFNPLPSLEALHIGGVMHFPVAYLLAENRARFRRLSADLTYAFVASLCANSAPASGGFPKLDCFSMWLNIHSELPRSVLAARCMRLFELCTHARTVRIGGTGYPFTGDVHSRIRLSPSLQYLDLDCVRLTVDQCMAVLGAYPRLHTAVFQLTDAPGADKSKRLAKRDVAQYRKRHQAHPSRVRSLKLHRADYDDENPHRASDHVLLLVSLLPTVAKVTFLYGFNWYSDQFAGPLKRARRGPLFKDVPHLADVEFLHIDRRRQ